MIDCEVSTVNLGDKVKDKVTGTRGTIVAETRYLYGSPRVLLQYENKAGNISSIWKSKDELEVI